MFTVGVVMLVAHHDPTREFAYENFWLFWAALILVFTTLITLSCCEGVRRTSPHNVIFLTLFTVGESVCVGYCTLNYDPDLVSFNSNFHNNASHCFFFLSINQSKFR